MDETENQCTIYSSDDLCYIADTVSNYICIL